MGSVPSPTVRFGTGLGLSGDGPIARTPGSRGSEPAEERPQISTTEAGDPLFVPLPDMNQFVGEEQARTVVGNVGGEEDVVTQRDADVGPRKRRNLMDPDTARQRPRDVSIAVELDGVQSTRRHRETLLHLASDSPPLVVACRMRVSSLRWWLNRDVVELL